MQRIKNFDIYRHVPAEMTETTWTGGIVSIVCLALVVILFLSEFASYLSVETHHELVLDGSVAAADQNQRIRVNINISLPSAPCSVLGLDVMDIMGGHSVDVGGEIQKIRLDQSGTPKVDMYNLRLPVPEHPTPEQLNEQKNEGCQIVGTLFVKLVPGNFHISCHSHGQEVAQFARMPNVSHTVHHLSFGEPLDLAEESASPLDGFTMANTEDGTTSFEYYIRVLPTTLKKTNGDEQRTYQYRAASNEVVGMYRVPAVYFRYELSPIAVIITKSSQRFTHFLVQICAIIGGIFTVLGLINSMIHSGVQKVMQKARINKLG